jgi:hypothetical protein
MGILSRLFGGSSSVDVLGDSVWLSQRSKLAGISKMVNECFAQDRAPIAVVLVAHFPNFLVELKRLGPFEGPVMAMLARELSTFTASHASVGEDQSIEIVVGERHPLAKYDEQVVAFARSLPCQCRIGFHVSLDDPLLKMLTGEWVEGILRQLGMKEDEAMQSGVIARRIQVAQRSIEHQMTGDSPADSAEHWLEQNCRLS